MIKEKPYTVRCEVSLILEVFVDAVHEDEAAALGEVIAADEVEKWVHDTLDGDNQFYAASWGVRAIEAEEDEADEE